MWYNCKVAASKALPRTRLNFIICLGFYVRFMDDNTHQLTGSGKENSKTRLAVTADKKGHIYGTKHVAMSPDHLWKYNFLALCLDFCARFIAPNRRAVNSFRELELNKRSQQLTALWCNTKFMVQNCYPVPDSMNDSHATAFSLLLWFNGSQKTSSGLFQRRDWNECPSTWIWTLHLWHKDNQTDVNCPVSQNMKTTSCYYLLHHGCIAIEDEAIEASWK